MREIPIELVDAPPPEPLPEAVEVESLAAAPIEDTTELAALVDDEVAKPPPDDMDVAESPADPSVPSDPREAALPDDDHAAIVSDREAEPVLEATLRREDDMVPAEDVAASSAAISEFQDASPSDGEAAASEPLPESVDEEGQQHWDVAAAEPYPTALLGIDPIEQAKDVQAGSAETAVRTITWTDTAPAAALETPPDTGAAGFDAWRETVDGETIETPHDAGTAGFETISAVDADTLPIAAPTTEVDASNDAGADARTLYGALLRAHLIAHGALAAEGHGSSAAPAIMIFTVDRAGRASRIRLARSSGSKQTDDTARKIILEAAPFPPFPDKIRSDSLIVRIPVRPSRDR